MGIKPFVLMLAVAVTATAAMADDVSNLVKQLKSGDVEVRRTAAKALGDGGPSAKDAVPGLTEALRDSDLYVRRFAAQSLGQIGPAAKSAVPALSTILKRGSDRKEVLAAVTDAISKIGGGSGSVDALAATLVDSSRDTESRRAAAEALGKLGSAAKPAIPALLEVLKPLKAPPAGSSNEIRAEAAAALGEIATPTDKRAVETLKAVSDDRMAKRDPALMRAVNGAMKKIQAKQS
jgi:HEAT repeat protein